MVESVDTPDLKSVGGNPVGVQVSLLVLNNKTWMSANFRRRVKIPPFYYKY